MIEIQAEEAETPMSLAIKMVDAVKKTDSDVFAVLGGICIAANQFSTVKSICDDYARYLEQHRQSSQKLTAS